MRRSARGSGASLSASRRRADDRPPDPARRAGGGGGEREPGRRDGARRAEPAQEAESLLERKARALAALREIEANRAEGNLSEEDYASLRREYEAEAAAILRKLDEGREGGEVAKGRVPSEAGAAETATAGPRRRSSGLVWGVGVVVFTIVVGIALAQAIRPRGPDGSITGNEIAGGGSPMGGGMGGAMGGGSLVPLDASRIPGLEARLQKDSADLEALVELSHAYIAMQRFREAANLSMRALRIEPRNARAMTHLGVVLWANGELETALQAFNHAIEWDPELPEPYLFKGLVSFAGLQDFQGAIEAWQRHLALAPPDANPDRVRGMLEGARRAAAAGSSRSPS